MRRKTVFAVLVLSLAILAASVMTSAARCGGRGACGSMGPGMATKPLFTTEQKEQMEKVQAKFEDQRVELHNKMAAMRLEIREMLEADEPDFGKLESRIDEIAAVRVKLIKMRLQQHREVRGLLTPEQRKLFDRGFDLGCGGPCGGMRGGCAMGEGKPGCGMGGPMMGGCMPGCQGQTGGMGMGAGLMSGPGQGHPGCPMMGGPGGGAMQGMKQQSEPWRRWL